MNRTIFLQQNKRQTQVYCQIEESDEVQSVQRQMEYPYVDIQQLLEIVKILSNQSMNEEQQQSFYILRSFFAHAYNKLLRDEDVQNVYIQNILKTENSNENFNLATFLTNHLQKQVFILINLKTTFFDTLYNTKNERMQYKLNQNILQSNSQSIEQKIEQQCQFLQNLEQQIVVQLGKVIQILWTINYHQIFTNQYVQISLMHEQLMFIFTNFKLECDYDQDLLIINNLFKFVLNQQQNKLLLFNNTTTDLLQQTILISSNLFLDLKKNKQQINQLYKYLKLNDHITNNVMEKLFNTQNLLKYTQNRKYIKNYLLFNQEHQSNIIQKNQVQVNDLQLCKHITTFLFKFSLIEYKQYLDNDENIKLLQSCINKNLIYEFIHFINERLQLNDNVYEFLTLYEEELRIKNLLIKLNILSILKYFIDQQYVFNFKINAESILFINNLLNYFESGYVRQYLNTVQVSQIINSSFKIVNNYPETNDIQIAPLLSILNIFEILYETFIDIQQEHTLQIFISQFTMIIQKFVVNKLHQQTNEKQEQICKTLKFINNNIDKFESDTQFSNVYELINSILESCFQYQKQIIQQKEENYNLYQQNLINIKYIVNETLQLLQTQQIVFLFFNQEINKYRTNLQIVLVWIYENVYEQNNDQLLTLLIQLQEE